MKVSIIVAYSDHRVIGVNNKLLWHLSDDLKNFKRLTMGHFMIMGRKTWDSLGKPLPGRTHLVISGNKDFSPAGAKVFHTLEDALLYADGKGQEEVFVIGGEQIYRLAFPHADKLYVTVVRGSFEGDAYFPEIEADQWELVSWKLHPEDEKHPYAFEMLELARRNS